MLQRKTRRQFIASLTLFACTLACAAVEKGQTDSHSPSYLEISVATRIDEVQHGSVDGRDFLTISIGGHDVGPSGCRGNVLRMHSNSNTNIERQQAIETVALSAILTAEAVMVVIPLDNSQCVDGKPTFTDLYVLPASP